VSSEANTINETTSTTHIGGSIGVTGDQAVHALDILATATYRGLQDLVAVSGHTTSRGYEFASGVVEQQTALVDRTFARSSETLANLVNATRDFSQRSIAASTGQGTPLQHLAGASATVPTLEPPDRMGGIPKVAIYGAIALGSVFLLIRKGGK
jgi:hypothetical protein